MSARDVGIMVATALALVGCGDSDPAVGSGSGAATGSGSGTFGFFALGVWLLFIRKPSELDRGHVGGPATERDAGGE